MPQMKPLMWMFMMPLSVLVLLTFSLMLFYLQYKFLKFSSLFYKKSEKNSWMW